MSEPLALCIAGALSPEVVLARLVLVGLSPAEIVARVHLLPGGGRTARLRKLAKRQDALG